MQVLNSFYVDCLDKNDYEHPLQLRVDKQGNLHMITSRNDNTYHYYIVASDGTFFDGSQP
ncbi:MAG: hypothetical protein K2K63_00395 [Acetatifactor sp.]|nr:hypothetical protein [Acetatifactor sp.]